VAADKIYESTKRNTISQVTITHWSDKKV